MESNFLYKTSQEFCYVLSDVYNHDNTEQGYKEAFRWSFVLFFYSFLKFPRKPWPGCFRVFSKDEEGAIPADEIKWSIFAWTSMITLSKMCYSTMFVRFIWFTYLMCLFVQICTDAPTWDQGQGESELLVSKKWKVLLSTKFSKEMKMKHIILAKSEGYDHLT